MTDRQRFKLIARCELKGELFVPSDFQWFWHETLVRWVNEGAPPEILSNEHRAKFFEFGRVETLPVVSGISDLGPSGGPPYVAPVIPRYERRVLEEDLRTRVVVNEGGVKYREHKDDPEKMPQWLEYPASNKKGWEEYKKRLDPHAALRWPAYWEDYARSVRERNYALGINVGSFFGLLREWAGLENLLVMFYDEPELVNEMLDHMEQFELEIIKKVVRDVDLDFAYFWEDMAYKNGSLISPQMFREYLIPRYLSITQLLRDNGIDIILVDSDGDTRQLIPLWIESGINGQYPLEATANMDAVRLREEYPNFILIGNIDKRTLAKSREAIEEELSKKIPYLLSRGGYFPAIDHFVPPDVSFKNYMYYLECLREMAGT